MLVGCVGVYVGKLCGCIFVVRLCGWWVLCWCAGLRVVWMYRCMGGVDGCVWVYGWCVGDMSVWVYGWCGCMLVCMYG